MSNTTTNPTAPKVVKADQVDASAKPSTLRVVTAYKRRFVRKVKRRTPGQRLRSRMYYRVHKSKIKLQRRRYRRKNKLFMRSRKLFKRVKPHWLSPKKQHQPHKKRVKVQPHPQAKRPKKINIRKPPRPRVRKAHVPKRRAPRRKE
jgi:hypothetical protein